MFSAKGKQTFSGLVYRQLPRHPFADSFPQDYKNRLSKFRDQAHRDSGFSPFSELFSPDTATQAQFTPLAASAEGSLLLIDRRPRKE